MTRRRGIVIVVIAALIAGAAIFFSGMGYWPVRAARIPLAAGSTIIALGGEDLSDTLANPYPPDRIATAIDLVRRTPGSTLVTVRNSEHGRTSDADQRRII